MFKFVIRVKGKAEHLYTALHGIQTTLKCSGMDHTDSPAINTIPALVFIVYWLPVLVILFLRMPPPALGDEGILFFGRRSVRPSVNTYFA